MPVHCVITFVYSISATRDVLTGGRRGFTPSYLQTCIWGVNAPYFQICKTFGQKAAMPEEIWQKYFL